MYLVCVWVKPSGSVYTEWTYNKHLSSNNCCSSTRSMQREMKKKNERKYDNQHIQTQMLIKWQNWKMFSENVQWICNW